MMLLFDQSPAATVHTFISPWNLDHELLAFFLTLLFFSKRICLFLHPMRVLPHIGHFEKRIFILIRCLNFAWYWYKCAENELTFVTELKFSQNRPDLFESYSSIVSND